MIMAMNEAKEKIWQLENAIKKLDSIKKHLSHSASDIKGEIHSCVSHNLESLRGREVSLLSKVDEVVGLKEEALQQQQARLNQALGVLRTRMALTANSSSSLSQEKQVVQDILAKFNDIDLSPDETPHIAFRADHMALRECISTYGRVDSNALPLPTAFDHSEKPSASLPRHLEEYEDADHHIFYKTVEDLKPSNNAQSKSITVTIPKLSTKMEDWLQKRLAPQMDIEEDKSKSSATTVIRPAMFAPATTNNTVTPQQNMNMTSTGSLSVPQPASSTTTNNGCQKSGGSRIDGSNKTCSLNSWLSQIKGHADLEEEHNFEIVDNSFDNRAQSTSNKENLRPWLLSSPGYVEQLIDSKSSTSNLFQHIPHDIKFWLHQSQQQMSAMEELKHRDFFCHISKEPSTWLRSRAYGKQAIPTTVNPASSGCEGVLRDKSMNKWLAQSSQPKEESMDISNSNCCKPPSLLSWLQQPAPAVIAPKPSSLLLAAPTLTTPAQDAKPSVTTALASTKAPPPAPTTVAFELEDICKANELCASVMDCVCKPDCLFVREQETSGVNIKNPLDPKNVFNPIRLPTSEWLLQGSSACLDVDVDVDEKMDTCDHDEDAREKNRKKQKMSSDSQTTTTNSDNAVFIGNSVTFSHIAEPGNDQWLFKPVEPAVTVAQKLTEAREENAVSLPHSNFKHTKEEANLWLQQHETTPVAVSSDVDSTTTTTGSDVASLGFDFSHLNKPMSEWLVAAHPTTTTPLSSNTNANSNANNTAKYEEEPEMMKEDSEGWSLCSTPTSFSSEQFSKDVRAATSYIENWVL